MPWGDIVQFAQLVGLMLAVIGLAFTAVSVRYAGQQLRVSQKIAAGDFLLRFDDMLINVHNDVHTKLRPGGDWYKDKGGPKSEEEWIQVERYMGMFERINILVESGILDVDTVDRFYGYRIRNVVANDMIRRTKLESHLADYWQDFISLSKAVEASHQKRLANRDK